MNYRQLLLVAGFSFLAATQIFGAGNMAQPFEVITRENAFRLKPPTPQDKGMVATVERPQVTLQGFTTLLGGPQVLLSIHELKRTGMGSLTCVLASGESREGITILEINVKSEMVRINNLGSEQILVLGR